RDGGPNKGVSYYDDRITYNKALPDDGFADIYRHDYVYLWDPNVAPEYFRVTETTEFANPHGDFIQWRVAYGIPELMYDMWYPQTFTADVVSPELSHWQVPDPNYDGTPYAWGQSLDESYFTGSVN